MGYVQRRQCATVVKHRTHTRDFGGIEAGHVQRRQGRAGVEHIAHGCDVGSVKIADVVNSPQIFALAEPCCRGRGFDGIRERHDTDVFPLIEPRSCGNTPFGVPHVAFLQVDIIGTYETAPRILIFVALLKYERAVVVEERENGVFIREVPRRAGRVHTGVFLIRIVRVTGSSVADKGIAVVEHIFDSVKSQFQRKINGEFVGSVDFSQRATAGKHPAHIRDVGGIETRQVQRRQGATVVKHTRHIRDFGGIEAGQVQRRQAVAVVKHIMHIRDVGGVKVG